MITRVAAALVVIGIVASVAAGLWLAVMAGCLLLVLLRLAANPPARRAQAASGRRDRSHGDPVGP